MIASGLFRDLVINRINLARQKQRDVEVIHQGTGFAGGNIVVPFGKLRHPPELGANASGEFEYRSAALHQVAVAGLDSGGDDAGRAAQRGVHVARKASVLSKKVRVVHNSAGKGGRQFDQVGPIQHHSGLHHGRIKVPPK